MRRLLSFVLSAAFVAVTFVPARSADLSLTENLPHPTAGGVPWSAKDLAKLRTDITKMIDATPTLRGAQVGFLAIDTTRGTVLYSHQADGEFQPASNFKLLVGSAVVDKLGPDFAFHTSVLAAGTIANGTLTGDIYLKGGGDAHLTAKDLDAAAAAIAAKGITRITGSVIGDATRYDDERYPQGWDWDDLMYYYAPPISALSLEENVWHAFMTPGATVGDPVTLRSYPATTAFTIENKLTTGPAKSKDTSDFVHPWDQPRTIQIVGSYPLGAKESGDLSPAVPDPAAYAVDVFTKALAAHGVTVVGAEQTGGEAPSTATELWSHVSEPLPQLMADFWWPSDNLMGELFLKELSVATGTAQGNDDAGAAYERTFLKRIGADPSTVTIADGSGLSNYDRITPRDLVKLLQFDWKGPNRNLVLNALPVSGVAGTLRHAYLGTPAEKNLWAKTGSINHVRTMSGFIRTRRHGAVTFSLMVNDWMEDNPGAAAGLSKLRGALVSRIVTD